ncbi:MAG: radical SAM protein [Pseudomonadota bacterium]
MLNRARERMAPVYTNNQLIGRSLSIGCVAVEITQRCNLDCTLCYLSEHSESVSDIPIEEVFRRLDEVKSTYGERTSVQITGGDPTLRKHHELVEIVRYARDLGLFPALFTNGIAASRKLLTDLAAVGLCDVAFHVDTTQQREGFDSELALNEIREEYLQRAAGLGLMVMFNTTVHRDNFHEIESLVEFFVGHADEIGLASFQLQAETGRGVWGSRDEEISLASVKRRIDKRAAASMPWELIRIGHPKCHNYLPTLTINGRLYPLIDDQNLFTEFVEAFSGRHADRRLGKWQVIANYLLVMLRQPVWLGKFFIYVAQSLWRARRDLWRSKGRVAQISFFVQNFMDASELDQERVGACSFMVMTADGPVSMCEHNANRDEYILKPITFRRKNGELARFDPLQGRNTRREAPARKSA